MAVALSVIDNCCIVCYSRSFMYKCAQMCVTAGTSNHICTWVPRRVMNTSITLFCEQPHYQADPWMRMKTLIARFRGATWGPPGADRTQVGLVLASWTLLSGYLTNWGTYLCGIVFRCSETELIAVVYIWCIIICDSLMEIGCRHT